MALRFIAVDEVRLQFVAGVHRKEYRVRVDRPTNTVTVSWGRIGGAMQTQVLAATGVFGAQELAVKKVTEKERKGYRQVAEKRDGRDDLITFPGYLAA